jgi:type II secretory pathway predicted ATPase ExeA
MSRIRPARPHPGRAEAAASLYTNAELRAVYALLLCSVEKSPGVVVVTGEPGSGKTALAGRLSAELRGCGWHVISDYRPGLVVEHLVSAIVRRLEPDLPSDHPPSVERAQAAIARGVSGGRSVALMIDDAHLLGGAVLTRLPALLRQPDGAPGELRLVLVGLPQLTPRLRAVAVSELSARLVAHLQVPAFSDDDIAALICRRCGRGQPSPGSFSPAALSAIGRHAKGNPARAIRLAAVASERARGRGSSTIDEAEIHDAAEAAFPHDFRSTDHENGNVVAHHITLMRATCGAALLGAVFAAGLALWGGANHNSADHAAVPRNPPDATDLATRSAPPGHDDVIAPSSPLDSESSISVAAVADARIEEVRSQSGPAKNPTIAAPPSHGAEIGPADPTGEPASALMSRDTDRALSQTAAVRSDLGAGASPGDQPVEADLFETAAGFNPVLDPLERTAGDAIATVVTIDSAHRLDSAARDEDSVAHRERGEPGGDHATAALPLADTPLDGVPRNAASEAEKGASPEGASPMPVVAAPEPESAYPAEPDLLDRGVVNAPAEAPAPPTRSSTTLLSDDIVIVLVKRGWEMWLIGDISGARSLFERAAEAGSAEAAVGAGQTYDPLYLAKLPNRAALAGRERAIGWYRRALAAGQNAALERIARLEAFPEKTSASGPPSSGNTNP